MPNAYARPQAPVDDPVAHPAANPKAKHNHASESRRRIRTHRRIALISTPNARLPTSLIVLDVTEMRTILLRTYPPCLFKERRDKDEAPSSFLSPRPSITIMD